MLPPSSSSALGGAAEGAHVFQEYTYKKITPCDICSQILRGEESLGMEWNE